MILFLEMVFILISFLFSFSFPFLFLFLLFNSSLSFQNIDSLDQSSEVEDEKTLKKKLEEEKNLLAFFKESGDREGARGSATEIARISKVFLSFIFFFIFFFLYFMFYYLRLFLVLFSFISFLSSLE